MSEYLFKRLANSVTCGGGSVDCGSCKRCRCYVIGGSDGCVLIESLMWIGVDGRFVALYAFFERISGYEYEGKKYVVDGQRNEFGYGLKYRWCTFVNESVPMNVAYGVRRQKQFPHPLGYRF